MTTNRTWAYTTDDGQSFRAGELTRGPWHPDHQHAGPPSALVCRAIGLAAAEQGFGHLGRLTGSLMRPVTIGECRVEVSPDYVGRNAGHYSARLFAGGREVGRFTALMQREVDVPVPTGTAGHPLPGAPKSPHDSPACRVPFAGRSIGYGNLIETRLAEGRFFDGPCAAWFRLRHPLVAGEDPSPYERVAVAADSGNGISASLDFGRYSFINCDLTINLLRRPVGEWICLQSRSAFGGNGCGLADSALYDQTGLIGRATQSLALRERITAALGQLLDEVNASLAAHERLHRLVVTREPWSIDNGCLTPTMKVRRGRIEAVVTAQVDGWYAAEGPVIWA